MSKRKVPRPFDEPEEKSKNEDEPDLFLPEKETTFSIGYVDLPAFRVATLERESARNADTMIPAEEPLKIDTSNKFGVGSAVSGVMLKKALGPNVALSDEDCLNLAAHLLHRSNAGWGAFLDYWTSVARDNPDKPH